MTLRDIAIKNLLRRKTKAAFILAGLMIGVATVVTVIGYTQAMTHDINTKLEKYGANILIVPHTDNLTLNYGGVTMGGIAFDLQPIRQTDLSGIHTIKNAANIAAIGPMVLGAVKIGTSQLLLAGIDFGQVDILKPWWKIDGQVPKGDQVLVGSEAERILGLSIGQRVDINGRGLTVAGMLLPTGSQDDQLIFTSLMVAQEVLYKPDQLSLVEVAALCHDCPIDEMVAQIAQKLPSAKVMAIGQVVKGRMETLAQFKKFSFGVSIVVVLVGGLVVLVTLMGSVKERTQEIGIFRAIGFRRSHVMRIVFMEACAVSAMAGILGYLAGMGAVWIAMRAVGHLSVALHADLTLAIGSILMAVAVGLLASAYPAIVASRMDPNHALKAL